MTNKHNKVLYTGMTNDLIKRIIQHKTQFLEGFTKKYNVNKLVYYEVIEDPITAIEREKQIKAGSRKKKIDFIHGMNPEWDDLYDTL